MFRIQTNIPHREYYIFKVVNQSLPLAEVWIIINFVIQ